MTIRRGFTLGAALLGGLAFLGIILASNASSGQDRVKRSEPSDAKSPELKPERLEIRGVENAYRLAPRLLAEIGDDRQRYQNAASLQALAGTSPVPYESGNYAKPHRRYACIKPLRNALQQFAWQSTKTESWALEY